MRRELAREIARVGTSKMEIAIKCESELECTHGCSVPFILIVQDDFRLSNHVLNAILQSPPPVSSLKEK